MDVVFEIITAAGEKVVGPVQGCGGTVGGGAMHLGLARARELAMEEMRKAIHRVDSGLPTGFAEPDEGGQHVFVWIDDSHRQSVDLRGASVTLTGRKVVEG